MGTKNNLPQYGWIYVGVNDLLNVSGNCELCGASLRYQHILYHEKVGKIKIGVECASYVMSGEEMEKVREADKEAKKISAQKKRSEKRQLDNFNARNEFNRSHGMKELSWEEYIAVCEKNRRRKHG